MIAFDVEHAASQRLDEIYKYTAEWWGHDQAARYVEELLGQFEAIAAKRVPWHRIPDALGAQGFRRQYGRHYFARRVTSTGPIAIMTILHDRMEQAQHLAVLGD